MDITSFSKLVANSKVLSIGDFLKSSTIIDTLNILADTHLDLAIKAIKNLKDYPDEKHHSFSVLHHLETAHGYYYAQRLEGIKYAYNFSLKAAISTGFNINKFNEIQYKEAYIACLLAATHCYLGSGISVISEYAWNAVDAIKNHPIKDKDRIYFPYDDSPGLKLKYEVIGSFAYLASFANYRNWSYVFEDEKETIRKAELIVDHIIEFKNNLISRCRS